VEDVGERPGACHACGRVLPATPSTAPVSEGISSLGRYRCPDCSHDFCVECDVFVHDVVHCCPGCGK
jgi:transcription initiation factor TFIIH subunit 2